MKALWFKRMVSVLLFSALALSTLGCQSNYKPRDTQEHSSPTAVNDGEAVTLSVYYLNESAFPLERMMNTFTDWFSKENANVTVETTAFDDAATLNKALETDGFPDVLLLRGSNALYDLDPYQWIQDEQVLSLNDFIESDTTFKAENYVSGLMESGQVDSRQYFMPLSIQMQALFLPQSSLTQSSLGTLRSDYSLEEMLNALAQEKENNIGNPAHYTYVPAYFDYSKDNGLNLLSFLQQTGVLRIDRTGHQVTVNEEAFPAVIAAYREGQNDRQRFETDKTIADLSFAEQQSRASTSVSNLCLPLAMRYFHTGYFEFLDQPATAFFYPNAASETQSYSALVNLAGMVGAQSEHAETAYSFLRSIMDLPANYWLTVTMFASEADAKYDEYMSVHFDALTYMTPVNLSALEQLSPQFNVEGGNVEYKTESGFNRWLTLQPLTDEQCTAITHVYNTIDHTYMLDGQSASIVQEQLAPYLTGETDSTEGLAASVQSALTEALFH